MQGNKTRRRAGRDRCVLWVRTGCVGHVGTAGVDRVEALDLVEQITSVRGGSAGTWGVRAKGTAVAETRRSRKTFVVAQRSRRLGATTVEGAWHGGAAWRLPWQTRRRHAVSVWCCRARRARRMRAGRAGRRGTPGVCRLWRWSSACVAGVVTEHGATGVVAPGRVRRLGHARDDDNDGSCNNFDDGKACQD